jgi:chromosome segregation ATPase
MLVAAHADVMLRSTLVRFVESDAMNENDADTPEQVLKFVPKEQPRSYAPLVEEAGEAIIAKIQKAADLSNENCDRAMKLAHKLSMQLRAAEERINQLEAEIELFRNRAARAEGWLQTIQKEIEEKLITPRSASGTEQRLLP